MILIVNQTVSQNVHRFCLYVDIASGSQMLVHEDEYVPDNDEESTLTITELNKFEWKKEFMPCRIDSDIEGCEFTATFTVTHTWIEGNNQANIVPFYNNSDLNYKVCGTCRWPQTSFDGIQLVHFNNGQNAEWPNFSCFLKLSTQPPGGYDALQQLSILI